MPAFRITACHTGSQPDTADFFIQPIRDALEIGDKFVCFDTHHPVEYHVTEIHPTGSELRLVCQGRLGFDGQFTGATVDTSGRSRREAFRYEITQP